MELNKATGMALLPALISPGVKREINLNLINTAKAVRHFVLQNTTQRERNTLSNHLRLPAQPRAQEHAGWHPFVQASATDKRHLGDSAGSGNGEMLGTQARCKSF